MPLGGESARSWEGGRSGPVKRSEKGRAARNQAALFAVGCQQTRARQRSCTPQPQSAKRMPGPASLADAAVTVEVAGLALALYPAVPVGQHEAQVTVTDVAVSIEVCVGIPVGVTIVRAPSRK